MILSYDGNRLKISQALLYGALTVTFVTRMLALSYPLGSPENARYDVFSYNLLSFVAPMFWCRMLLYLDAIKFFGAMLVVLKVMMQESLMYVSQGDLGSSEIAKIGLVSSHCLRFSSLGFFKHS